MLEFKAKVFTQDGHPVSDSSIKTPSCTLGEIILMLFELEKIKMELLELSNDFKPEYEIRKKKK